MKKSRLFLLSVFTIMLAIFLCRCNAFSNPYEGYHEVVEDIEFLNPNKKFAIEGEDVVYEIKYNPQVFGDKILKSMVKMKGFDADIAIENKANNCAIITFKKIKATKERAVGEETYCGISIGNELVWFNTVFEIVDVYTDISLPSKLNAHVGDTIYFDITFHAKEIAVMRYNVGNIVLYGFKAPKKIIVNNQDERSCKLILEDLSFLEDETKTTSRCSIAVNGGVAVSKQGEMSDIAKSSSFTLSNNVDYYLNNLANNGWIVITTVIIAAIAAILSIILNVLNFIDRYKKKKSLNLFRPIK